MTRLKTVLLSLLGFIVIPFVFYMIGFLVGVLALGFKHALNLW